MNENLEKYLNNVDRHLKPITISERMDIINEIKSSIEDMKKDGLSEYEIINRLGDSKQLAANYVYNILGDKPKISFKNILKVISLYSLVGISGIFILPLFIGFAVCFGLASILTIIAGIWVLSSLFIKYNVELPVFSFTGTTLGPIESFIASLVIAIVCLLISVVSWKIVTKFVKVSKSKLVAN